MPQQMGHARFGPNSVREKDGPLLAYDICKTTHHEVVERLGSEGFRLPTSDEWEYLCGAGTRNLFRWGGIFPTDRYPGDKLADEKIVNLLQDWEPGDRYWEPEDWEWDFHRRPNAWGLRIARDPYQLEIVSEPKVLRGGDGGEAVCGGEDYYWGWLPLANSYFRESADLEQNVTLKLARRVVTIDTSNGSFRDEMTSGT